MIENLRNQEDKICVILSLSLKKFADSNPINTYNPILITSGITHFEHNKIYLDTSSIEGVNRISGGQQITFSNRPSRANMQPVEDSVWFARMKGSSKTLIITKNDEDIIRNYVLSTGFLGVLATENLPLSLLTAIVISNSFRTQRDANSIGTTMAGVNNNTFMEIMVPSLDKKEMASFERKLRPFIEKLSRIRITLNSLKIIKSKLLCKYF